MIPWLEDQKIRHYKIVDRKDLQNTSSDKWNDAFQKYLQDTGCPDNLSVLSQLEWLINLAIRLEFEDGGKYISYILR